MKKKKKPESFIKQPNYPGGKKALTEFIKANIHYPGEALNQNVQGSVFVKYDIDVYGNVVTATIVHGIGHGCDEEALRLVKLLKYEKKKYHGFKVTFHQAITITFHLPAISVTKQQDIAINYHYNESNSSGEKFTYSIVSD